MKTKLFATSLLAGSSVFAATRFGIGFGFGVPAPAPVVVAPPVASYVPPCPGPGYEWLGGSWVFRGGPRDFHRADFYDRDHGRMDYGRARDFRHR